MDFLTSEDNWKYHVIKFVSDNQKSKVLTPLESKSIDDLSREMDTFQFKVDENINGIKNSWFDDSIPSYFFRIHFKTLGS